MKGFSISDFGLRLSDFFSRRADRGNHDRRELGGFLEEGNKFWPGEKVPLGDPKSPIQNPNAAAFTLIELLVAMAVLALVLVLMTQAVNGVLQSTRVQNQQMDSVAAARRALDVMASDLAAAVIDDSRTVLVSDGAGSGLFSLFARKRGPEGVTNHRFLAVRYALESDGRLIRSYASESFVQSLPSEPSNSVVLSSGILGFQMRARTENGSDIPTRSNASPNWATNSYFGQSIATGSKALVFQGPAWAMDLTNRTAGLELWMAAVDEPTLMILKETGKLELVTDKLTEVPDPHTWRSEIDSLDIPPVTKAALRILNKTVPGP